MTRYALMHGDVVATVVEQDHPPTIGGEWLECGQVGPGFKHVGDAFVAPADPVPERIITARAFLSRFSDDEAIAFDLASIGATEGAARLRRHQAKLNASPHIDLDFVETREGVQALESVGLIAPGRALQILDAEIQPDERP
jgi:hypothetical protein